MSDSDDLTDTSPGISSGTKAGIAILVVAVVFLVIFFIGTVFSVRRRQTRAIEDSTNHVELRNTQHNDAEDLAFIRSVFARSKRPNHSHATSANPFMDPSLNPPPPVYTPGPSNINAPPPAYNG